MLSPATAAEVRAAFDDLAVVAETVVTETAKAMDFDEAEFDERVTGQVYETAHEALFASLLSVTVGTRAEFEDWAAQADHDVEVAGSDTVDHVVWHAPPFADTAVAATFQDERAAAVATLRRQAHGRLYREVLS